MWVFLLIYLSAYLAFGLIYLELILLTIYIYMQFTIENECICIQICTDFCGGEGGEVDNKSSSLQIMACRRTGNKPLSVPVLS